MSLIKLALDQQKTGIGGFAQRHPVLTAGIALTGGLAAADAGVNAYKAIKGAGNGSMSEGLKLFKSNSGLRKQVGSTMKEGLKEGSLYGGILGTVEPAINHRIFKKPQDSNS